LSELPPQGVINHEQGAVERSRSGRAQSAQLEVWLLSAAMVAASLGLALTLTDVGSATLQSPWWAFIAIAAGFLVTEVTVFRFVFRREGIAFSLSEIPLAFCLVFLAPGPALIARAVASMSVIAFMRRLPAYKFAWNASSITLELSLAYVLFRGFVGLWGEGDTQFVIAAILATGVAGIVSSVLVSVAISRFEGDLWGRVLTELRLAWWLFFVNATLAGMVLALALMSPWLVLLRSSHWSALVRHQGLRPARSALARPRRGPRLHGTRRTVARSRRDRRAAVTEAAEILRTDGVALVVFEW
jgi:hypothetical protein